MTWRPFKLDERWLRISPAQGRGHKSVYIKSQYFHLYTPGRRVILIRLNTPRLHGSLFNVQLQFKFIQISQRSRRLRLTMQETHLPNRRTISGLAFMLALYQWLPISSVSLLSKARSVDQSFGRDGLLVSSCAFVSRSLPNKITEISDRLTND